MRPAAPVRPADGAYTRPGMADTPTVLFVYGTLKWGEKNFPRIRDQRFLGPAVTAPAYRLYDLGPYPGLVRDDVAGLAVVGELWEVSDCALAELDDFETSTDGYARRPIAVVGFDGAVEAYFYDWPLPPGARSGGRWPLD